jgi:H-NS histone family
LKGEKVPPKYRGPDGETWAALGATPRWLKVAIKEGKKLEQFLIEKGTPKSRKKRRSKKQDLQKLSGNPIDLAAAFVVRPSAPESFADGEGHTQKLRFGPCDPGNALHE